MISFSKVKRGGGIMSKCPFWSCNGETVSCYGECPMQELKFKGEECAFKEYLSDYDKFNLKYKDEYLGEQRLNVETPITV